jgi:LmbE family N-acetylglucosaminyl deacetylase
MNILVLAAHPDDEVLGCGGTIARMAQEGNDVFIAILGEGITSRLDTGQPADPNALEKLHLTCKEVARFLGARDVFIHNLPDNRFDTVPLLEIVKITERILRQVEPQVVFTHHGGDLNVDHSILCRATLTAARPLPGTSVRKIYSFEVPSSTEWSFSEGERRFSPNTFMDIAHTLEAKVNAMKLYGTEIRAFPHPRSPEALVATAQKWGATIGVSAAEAFQLIWSRE